MPKKPKTKKIKDTDYLTISARIRGMENTPHEPGQDGAAPGDPLR